MCLSRLSLALVPVLAAAVACGGSQGGSGSSSSSAPASAVPTATAGGGELTVAAAGFTESDVMANMFADLLSKAGFTTKVVDVASTEIFESSLEHGQVAVAPEYVATYADLLNTEINGASAPSVASPSLATSLAALQRLAAQRHISVLTPTRAVDQNAFAVAASFAAAHHLTTLSDLGRSHIAVTLAAGAECATRPFCVPGLEKTYGIKVKGIDKLGVDTIQGKRAVEEGKDQLALVLTTDATLPDFHLVALADDKHLQNADYLVPVVNQEVLRSHPQIAAALNRLAPVLTTADLANMDKQVDIDRQTAAAVAHAYLVAKGLL